MAHDKTRLQSIITYPANAFSLNEAPRRLGRLCVNFVRTGIGRGPITIVMADGEGSTGKSFWLRIAQQWVRRSQPYFVCPSYSAYTSPHYRSFQPSIHHWIGS